MAVVTSCSCSFVRRRPLHRPGRHRESRVRRALLSTRRSGLSSRRHRTGPRRKLGAQPPEIARASAARRARDRLRDRRLWGPAVRLALHLGACRHASPGLRLPDRTPSRPGRPWAFAALLFAAADPLLIAQSRIAMLDLFLALWTVASIYCALRYASSGRTWPWLWLCALALGAAVATKWSGSFALLALLGIAAWDRASRRRRPWRETPASFWPAWRSSMPLPTCRISSPGTPCPTGSRTSVTCSPTAGRSRAIRAWIGPDHAGSLISTRPGTAGRSSLDGVQGFVSIGNLSSGGGRSWRSSPAA